MTEPTASSTRADAAPAASSTRAEAAPVATPVAAPADRRRRHRPASPHAPRFRSVTAALVGLAIGALLVAVAIAAGGRHSTATARWSQWAPSGTGALAARDIADYVAPFYRVSSVDQLAVITVINLESADVAAAAAASGGSAAGGGLQVAVRTDPNSSAVSLLGGNTIAYNLCGIGGRDCAIGVGTPSTNRLLLLRREALELALYTFKYVSGTDNVVAILPPGHTETASTGKLSRKPPKAASAAARPIDIAVLFQRQELQPLLDHPLVDTLPEPVPPTVSQMPRAPEAGLVDQATARGLFSERLQQTQDGSSLIVLDPLPPQ